MVTLQSLKDFRPIQSLPFCYLCGKEFSKDDETDRDHVPAKGAFNARDKEPPLILKTHRKCNGQFSDDDKKFGQLIALKRFERPKAPRDYALKIVKYSKDVATVENLDIVAASWRCISGFHAALYRQHLPPSPVRAIELPFPRASKGANGALHFSTLKEQHPVFVENIKRNRAFNNVDRIVSNGRKMIYECVWCLSTDDDPRWLCMFAWDIYGWKDLGKHSSGMPARGCAGFYTLPDGSVPENAAREHPRGIIIPNYDPFDAFVP